MAAERARASAARLSLFWGDWATFADPPEAARLPPIVRRDLLDCGVAVLGGAPPDGLPRPTDDDLVRETAAFAAGWLERNRGVPDPDALLAAGRRATDQDGVVPRSASSRRPAPAWPAATPRRSSGTSTPAASTRRWPRPPCAGGRRRSTIRPSSPTCPRSTPRRSPRCARTAAVPADVKARL